MRHLYLLVKIALTGRLLVFGDCAHRADICTSAAFCTQIGIDAVDVTSGDSAYSAFVDASTASSAVF